MLDKNKIIDEALNNVRNDRKKTLELLKDLQQEIQGGDTTNSKSGIVAAKYVETLQRSNEQLVKIVTMAHKVSAPSAENLDFSEGEKSSIFEIIQKENSTAERQ